MHGQPQASTSGQDWALPWESQHGGPRHAHHLHRGGGPVLLRPRQQHGRKPLRMSEDKRRLVWVPAGGVCGYSMRLASPSSPPPVLRLACVGPLLRAAMWAPA